MSIIIVISTIKLVKIIPIIFSHLSNIGHTTIYTKDNMQMFIQKYYFSIYNINWFSNIKEGTYEEMKRGITTLLSVAVLSTSLVACSGTQEKQWRKKKVKLTDQQLMADLWYQTAGETKALYYQGYNIGQLKLDAALAKGQRKTCYRT